MSFLFLFLRGKPSILLLFIFEIKLPLRSVVNCTNSIWVQSDWRRLQLLQYFMNFIFLSLLRSFERIGLIRVELRLSCSWDYQTLKSLFMSNPKEIFIWSKFKGSYHWSFWSSVLHVRLFLLFLSPIFPNLDSIAIPNGQKPSLWNGRSLCLLRSEISVNFLICLPEIPDSELTISTCSYEISAIFRVWKRSHTGRRMAQYLHKGLSHIRGPKTDFSMWMT